MAVYPEDDLLALSALQHLLFCPRQCALIHLEQVWQENLFTAQGRLMHERVDQSGRESRKDVRIMVSRNNEGKRRWQKGLKGNSRPRAGAWVEMRCRGGS